MQTQFAAWRRTSVNALTTTSVLRLSRTEELETRDPDEKKGTATVENDLPEPVKYSDREDVKYDWERYLGELEASYVIG